MPLSAPCSTAVASAYQRLWRQPSACCVSLVNNGATDSLPLAACGERSQAPRSRLTAGRGQRRALSLSAPRRRAQHIHEFSHRAELFPIADGVDRARDGGWAEHPVGIGAEFSFDLGARQRVLGRTARMIAARLKRGAVAFDLDHRLHAGERRVRTEFDLL